LFAGALAAVGLLLPVSTSTRAADPTVAATWRRGDVLVDGSVVDWPRLERVGSGPAVAVQHDATTLYVALATSDETVRLQLATGLVVWLDGTAKRGQTFGLRLEGLTRRPLPGANPDAAGDSLSAQRPILTSLDTVDLLGPAKNQRRLLEHPAEVGIAAAWGVEGGAIAYEIRIPLAKGPATPYAVGARPGGTMTIGLETPPDPNARRQRSQLDDPIYNPWVSTPYGLVFVPPDPPPPGGRPQPPKEVVIKPLKLAWTIVRLATAPATAALR
jgi:hypothetical protein